MKHSLLSLICFLSITISFAQSSPALVHHKRQFRGVWMATVRNLDWPSEPGISPRKMKKEFIRQLDRLQELGMNAVIVQIRPSADALYASELEPWSEFLSGEQGCTPRASFDPLPFMIEEAHRRCMEFHAWFNPYRAGKRQGATGLSPNHIYFQHPEWFVQYGEDLYFDPGRPGARKFVERVIADVVSRYDIDAVHFDDHYYPYRIEGVEFPDSVSFALHKGDFSEAQRDDWRRENINLLVRELYDTINQIKPWVHFGISPFGVWRNIDRDPEGSQTHTLQTNYDDLFGDALTWLRSGWLDYILPQCYQYMGRPIMDYRVVTRWWNEHHYGTNFYIGQGAFRLGTNDRGARWTEGNEIDRQLYFNDSIPDLLGSAYFRSQTFLDNPLGVSDTLKNKFYQYPALAPFSHHDAERSCEVSVIDFELKETKKKLKLSWQADLPDQVRYYVIYRSSDTSKAENILALTTDTRLKLKKKEIGPGPYRLQVTAVDLFRQESGVGYTF
jgi:uncharacterized lipoprotein YddW (UPF0748 family)